MTNAKAVISDADFARLQKMAKLTLTTDEKSRIHSQLDEALEAVKVFDELDLTNVAPLAHPGELENVWREDIIEPSFSQAQALQNAPQSHAGYIMVPGVLEQQDA